MTDTLFAFVHLHDLALSLGWAVLGIGAVVAAVAFLTFVPYMALSVCWRYLKTQDDFIRIAMAYMKERKANERKIMGTPE